MSHHKEEPKSLISRIFFVIPNYNQQSVTIYSSLVLSFFQLSVVIATLPGTFKMRSFIFSLSLTYMLNVSLLAVCLLKVLNYRSNTLAVFLNPHFSTLSNERESSTKYVNTSFLIWASTYLYLVKTVEPSSLVSADNMYCLIS